MYDSRRRYSTITVLEKISQSRVRIGIEKTIYLKDGIILLREKNFNLNNFKIEENWNIHNNCTIILF